MKQTRFGSLGKKWLKILVIVFFGGILGSITTLTVYENPKTVENSEEGQNSTYIPPSDIIDDYPLVEAHKLSSNPEEYIEESISVIGTYSDGVLIGANGTGIAKVSGCHIQYSDDHHYLNTYLFYGEFDQDEQESGVGGGLSQPSLDCHGTDLIERFGPTIAD